MHELYELREKLCHELKKYSSEEITNSSLEVVDSLSHAIKNIDKIIDWNETSESGSYGYNRGYRGGSYGRGRGRNARRDSMGRYANDGYSKHGDMVEQLREMMMEAPTDDIRREYEKMISRIESM